MTKIRWFTHHYLNTALPILIFGKQRDQESRLPLSLEPSANKRAAEVMASILQRAVSIRKEAGGRSSIIYEDDPLRLLVFSLYLHKMFHTMLALSRGQMQNAFDSRVQGAGFKRLCKILIHP